MGEVKIRPALETDLAPMLAIYNFEVLNATTTLDVAPLTLDEWKAWYIAHTTSNHALLVAQADDKVVGYAGYGSYRSKAAYEPCVELSIYLDAAYRGRGIAGQLMTELLDIARGDERVHTVVSVITTGNEPSIKLHEKFGFATIGTMPEVAYKNDTWLGVTYMQLMV